MKWLRWYIVLIVVLLGIYMYAAYKRPAQIDWRPTLSNRDKIPFGTYIVFNNLQSIFNQKPHEIREPVYDHTNNNEVEDEVYILIAGNIGTTETDENELLQYISNGNTVFLSCEELSKSLSDTLKLEIASPAYFDVQQKDSTSLNFVNSFLKSKADYKMLKSTIDAYFSRFDTSKTTVLGVNNSNKVNYLRMPIGKGYIYLHSAPIAFSNYFALKDKNIEYVEKALSYLPANPSAVYWDEYYKIGRGGATTPLRVILTKKDLRYAYFIALATIILFVIFQSKRRQRIIPILEKPFNATVDFVETVSRVYFNRRHHHNIATKKVTYLLEHIRNRYGVHTTGLDEEFQARLVQKSGASKELVAELTSMVRYVRYGNEISEPELMKLNQLITNFYKNSSK